MLALKPNCENCGKILEANSTEARICSFECTFCAACIDDVLFNVCPNCGGGFEKRPIRPQVSLVKYPASNERFFRPIDAERFSVLLNTNKNIPPSQR